MHLCRTALNNGHASNPAEHQMFRESKKNTPPGQIDASLEEQVVLLPNAQTCYCVSFG